MSAIDATLFSISAEKESGAGEMNCYKTQICEESGFSHALVSEIMGDLLNNVFEIIIGKELQPSSKFEKITPTVVGDILDNILSPRPNSVSNVTDQTVLLNDEIKKIIKEMKYPTEQKIISTQGIGDQLSDKSQVAPDKVIREPVKRNTLERKNRLTNLVRNSKQMLAKFVSSESESEVRLTKSEEIHEKLLKVIDLEGNDHYVEPGSSSYTGILQMPSESTLQMVDLQTTPRSESEEQSEKTETEVMGPSSKTDSAKSVSTIKKKWNFGAKIVKYLRKNKEDKKEEKLSQK